MAVSMTWAGLDFPSAVTLMKSSCVCHELAGGEGRKSACLAPGPLEASEPSLGLFLLQLPSLSSSLLVLLPDWFFLALWILEQRICLGRDGATGAYGHCLGYSHGFSFTSLSSELADGRRGHTCFEALVVPM